MADDAEKPSNVHVLRDAFAHGLGEPVPTPVDGDDLQPDATDMADDRLSRLEGAYDALKVVRPMLMAVVSILLAVAIGTTAFLGSQVASTNSRIDRLGDKLDAIPARLNEELRAMRAEMTAQTSALANAITAAKQEPPQVILIPAPQPPPSAPTQQAPNKKQ
jgi:hypothetical protein